MAFSKYFFDLTGDQWKADSGIDCLITNGFTICIFQTASQGAKLEISDEQITYLNGYKHEFEKPKVDRFGIFVIGVI